MEAPFLAPKENPTPKTPQNEQTALTPLKANTASAEDPQASSSDESIPELIDLREEEGVPPKRINHATTLGLNKKMAVVAEKTPIPPSPFPKGNAMTLPVAAPEVNIEAEAVPEEQIIYIDDDIDPSPLSLLERQVDCLLMPPPTDTTPIVQRIPMPLRRDQQPPKVLERRRHPPSTAGKKTLQERRKGKPLKLNICTVAKMCTGPVEVHHAQELAWLASAVVSLQRLNIQEDTHVKVPKITPVSETPTSPLK